MALATALRLAFDPWLSDRAPFTLYFLPILYVAWIAGAPATLATTVLAVAASKYFLVPVRHSFELAPGEWASFAMFIVAAAGMTLLSRNAARLRGQALHNEQACRRAERGSRAAIWDWNSARDDFDAVALAEMFGLPGGAGRIAAADLEANVHPDDRKIFRKLLRDAESSERPVRAELRVQHPTDGLRWISIIGEASGFGGRVSGIVLDVTDRRTAEDAASERREWFEVTLRSIGDAVIASDRSGRITFMNAVAERLTGWSAADAHQQPLSEVFRIVNEKTREPVENPADKVMRTGVVIGLANHTALIARDGSERPIADSAAPILDRSGSIQGVILVFHDVTEERRAADEVAEQREWLQTTLECIGDAVIASDVRGRVVFMNPIAEYLTGQKLEEARGQDCTQVFRIVNEQSRAPVESPVGRVLREGVVVGLANHTILIASDGTERAIDDSGAPIRARDGRIVGVVLVFRDVSEKRAIENEKTSTMLERERLLASERAARSDAERANRLKDEFVATVSHELRNPLNAIVGWVRALQAKAPDAATLQQGLDVIDRNARMQSQLVADLLDMSSIASGKLRLDLGAVVVGRVVDEVVDSMQSAIAAKGIELRRQVEELPPIAADRDRLQQILGNLLANAVKFSRQGGRVTIETRRAAADVEIVVSDEGIGIAAEFLPHVFDRFRQADSSTTRRFGGLGLGLSIVKQLVDLHGGTITAESPGAGQGATFRVRLPIGSDPATAQAHDAFETNCRDLAELSRARLERLRILVVEDDADARELVLRLLTECGADAIGVASTTAALQRLAERPADIIISDIGLPGMDGYSFMRHLRRSPDARLARMPAIAMTAFARAEDRAMALQSGYQAHLVKPVDPAELVATVASFARLMP